MTTVLQSLLDSLASFSTATDSGSSGGGNDNPNSFLTGANSSSNNYSNSDKSFKPPLTSSKKRPLGSASSISLSRHDFQDLNSLARLRCWAAMEQCASTTDSMQNHDATTILTAAAGNAPLHSAISNGAPLSTVQALIIANPPSVAQGNHFGNTPLHFAAWKNKYADSCSIVAFLLDYHPQAAKATNKHGNLPLHHATNYKAHPDIVQLLYRANPSAILVKNDKGKTPLDLAMHRYGEKHPVVALLKGEDTRNYVYEQPSHNHSHHKQQHKQQQQQRNSAVSSSSCTPRTSITPTPRTAPDEDDYEATFTPTSLLADPYRVQLNHKNNKNNTKTNVAATRQIQVDVWEDVDLS